MVINSSEAVKCWFNLLAVLKDSYRHIGSKFQRYDKDLYGFQSAMLGSRG